MSELCTRLLSEDSEVMDPNVALPELRGFKVMADLGLVMVMFMRAMRQLTPAVKATIDPTFAVVEMDSPAQKKAREDYEATGNTWAGMASTVKNATAYSDFVNAQIKDLMVVFRHLIGTPHRRVLVPQIDKLFDERILLGTGIGNKEMLRTGVYTAVADLFHHLKGELTFPQLSRLVHMHLRIFHNPMVGNNVHILCAKILFGLPETIVTKESPENAARLLEVMFRSCLDRLDALTHIHDELIASVERRKGGDEKVEDAIFIERARPIGGASYALEKPEEVLQVFKLLIHGFRVTLGHLKKCNAPIADGTLIHRVFEGCIRCMTYFEPEARANESNDTIDWFGLFLLEVNLHVFQEVWTQNVGHFFECAQRKVLLMNICQFLFTKESTSPTLLAIILKFLVDRLPELGEYDDLKAAATIRLYKMAFGAVSAHPTTNEPILASHLAKLLMDCFPLATKATKPTHYFHLLRALFRAIGGGGGRFELLYKEVLPLLPDMLECLNRHLLASEGPTRDMIVELCLTVPLRLTHLLPHLSYLMQPLALALRGSPELVSQGLRTLELCIDNLTPDFLDPTLSIVLRELMEALHSHLKPLPSSHLLSHTTIRILGKLGGRNRRLLTKEPSLEYTHHSEIPKVTVSFGGTVQKLSLQPVGTLACRLMSSPTSTADVNSAYDYLEKSLSLLVHDGAKSRNAEEMFTKSLEALYDGTFNADTKGMSVIVQELVALAKQNNTITPEVFPILHQIANRFCSLCFDHAWARKAAGCAGIRIMTTTPDVGEKWVRDRGGDLVRTLIHVLKDLPADLPEVDNIVSLLTSVIKIGSADFDFRSTEPSVARPKLLNLARILFPELTSISPVIGIIEAVRFLISLDPPLLELNDELLRLLHETLALADAEDSSLLGRGNVRQGTIDMTKLRVASIKLLTASMPLTDFFSRQHQTRQRVTGVYFKSLYSPSQDVKDVAHEGLRMVLLHQSKLPKELLQTGLRPILMNLADPKRLSVPGLEGLARLLELLTNYFKVEIGHKLLDHFRIVADPQMLQASSRSPLGENEGITKLVRLANIFHLLPSSANIFLENLVNAIVQTEAQMHFSGQSPFSEPLAKYLDRYPEEGVDFFIRHIKFPRHMRTFRSILQAGLAPNLLRVLAARTHTIVTQNLQAADQHLASLYLLSDLA
ncbi:transcription-associated protein 1, partial [Marasmius crinis-equi]